MYIFLFFVSMCFVKMSFTSESNQIELPGIDGIEVLLEEPTPALLAQRERKRINTAAYRERLREDESRWAEYKDKERERNRNRPGPNFLEKEQRADLARARDTSRVQRTKADPVKYAAYLARRAAANKRYRERKKAELLAGKKRERE